MSGTSEQNVKFLVYGKIFLMENNPFRRCWLVLENRTFLEIRPENSRFIFFVLAVLRTMYNKEELLESSINLTFKYPSVRIS